MTYDFWGDFMKCFQIELLDLKLRSLFNGYDWRMLQETLLWK